MIGNDIIDLALARKESNWQRKGFLYKIFTAKEQQLILNAENSEMMVWNLWSRKEAAYKIFNRETGIRIYNPNQFDCYYENAFSGVVCSNGKQYYTKTEISEQKIHTIAVSLKSNLNQIIVLQDSFEIIKKEGAPYQINPVSNELIPVSISHHGRFKACVTLNQV